MNRKLFVIISVVLLTVVGSAIAASAQHKPDPQAPIAPIIAGQRIGDAPARPNAPLTSVSSGFTYQGRLTSSGSSANGQYDLRFALYDALTGGNQVSIPITLTSQTVTGGLF